MTNEIKKIADIVGLEFGYIANKIQNTDSSEVLIADSISHEKLLLLEEKINDFKNINIAYEPVWAIGTGNNCGVDEAKEAIECTCVEESDALQ
jgi:triosephosphate isomerase